LQEWLSSETIDLNNENVLFSFGGMEIIWRRGVSFPRETLNSNRLSDKVFVVHPSGAEMECQRQKLNIDMEHHLNDRQTLWTHSSASLFRQVGWSPENRAKPRSQTRRTITHNNLPVLQDRSHRRSHNLLPLTREAVPLAASPSCDCSRNRHTSVGKITATHSLPRIQNRPVEPHKLIHGLDPLLLPLAFWISKWNNSRKRLFCRRVTRICVFAFLNCDQM
jgi:hypothetical protein